MENRGPHFEEAARQRSKSDGVANPRPEDIEAVLESWREKAKKLPGGLFPSTAGEAAESLLGEASATERMDVIMLRYACPSHQDCSLQDESDDPKGQRVPT